MKPNHPAAGSSSDGDVLRGLTRGRSSGKTSLPTDGTTVGPAATPTCRYVADPMHVCSTSHGTPLREHQTCRAEASAQLADLLTARVAADLELARQEAMAADADARLEACERWQEEMS